MAKVRNQKLGQERGLTAREVDRAAAELQQAHEDALRLKQEAKNKGQSVPTAQVCYVVPACMCGLLGLLMLIAWASSRVKQSANTMQHAPTARTGRQAYVQRSFVTALKFAARHDAAYRLERCMVHY
jgi:hypothetical protein